MNVYPNLAASARLFERACNVLPGGVNSPVRSFSSVGSLPIYVSSANGARVLDEDGNEYIDFLMGFGALLLGHCDAEVVSAIADAASKHLTIGMVHRYEVEFAEMITAVVPSIELIRFVSSGTEATMTAVRIARGVTGRRVVVKFAGNYHGHADQFLVNAGSGLLTHGIASSRGVTPGAIADMIVLDYNDTEELALVFREMGHEIAAVIVEPVAGNMNLVEAIPGFLEACRRLTEAYGAVLIFDEVITGFRVPPSSAQQRFNIVPDLTALGKVIGGGMPIGAVGGRRDVMEYLSPKGAVYQAGTFGAHPVCLAAGLVTVRRIIESSILSGLEEMAKRLVVGLSSICASYGSLACFNQVGSIFGVHFARTLPRNLADVEKEDADAFRDFFSRMAKRGVLFAPSRFEAGFLSSAHTDAEIDATLERAAQTFEDLARVEHVAGKD